MQSRALVGSLCIAMLFTSCVEAADVIPMPEKVEPSAGRFEVTPQTELQVDSAGADAAALLRAHLQLADRAAQANGIVTVTTDGADSRFGDEGYVLHFMPMGWIGLMIGGLIAANSSTLLTHLNWGASYLVHDFYRRFVKTDATERHYVNIGRLATVLLFLGGGCLTFELDSAKNAFDLILLVGAGTGLLYLMRWFWWRVNAASEVVAMASSFGVSVVFFLLNHHGYAIPQHIQLLITIASTTLCWVAAAYLGPETDRQTLINFYLKVKPAGPGWTPIRHAAEAHTKAVEISPDNIPLAIIGWIAGCMTVWGALFAVGNILYGRWGYASAILLLLLISSAVLIWVVRRLWSVSAVDAEKIITV